MNLALNKKPQIAAITAAIIALSGSAQAAILFDFTSAAADTALDDVFAGATFSATDGSDTVVMTTLVVTSPEYDGTPALTGGTAAARTNITSNGVSVDNRTITNTPFGGLGGNTSESGTINPNEILTFSLDQTVTFTSIDFFGIGGSEIATISIGGGTPFSFGNTESGDVFADPFGAGFVIAAGTAITISGTTPTDLGYALTNFEVEVVPEPSSAALLGLGGLALIMRRRK